MHLTDISNLVQRFRDDRKGAITIEFALALPVLTILVVGIINMGLAYTEQMNVSNAVRAGSQFALVRHPSLDPNANTQQALVSIQDIRDAVVESAGFLAADPGSPDLTVCVFYQCPSAPPTTCTTSPSTAPSCTDWETFVEISLTHLYQFLIPFPGFNTGITLSAGHTIRLN